MVCGEGGKVLDQDAIALGLRCGCWFVLSVRGCGGSKQCGVLGVWVVDPDDDVLPVVTMRADRDEV